MPENTFDIVSKIDLQEVSNAIQQAMKEISTRFDLKDSKSAIALEGKDAILLHSIDEYKLKSVNDVFQQKLVKRGVPLKGLTYGAVEPAARPELRPGERGLALGDRPGIAGRPRRRQGGCGMPVRRLNGAWYRR